jgi:uncharacterized protein (DUF3084 family)
MRSYIAATEARLAETASRYREAQEKYHLARERYAQANENYLRARKDYENVQQEYAATQALLTQAQDRLDTVDQQLQKTKDELQGKEKELQNAERILANAEREIQNAQREVEDYQSKLTLLTAELKRLQTDKKQLDEQIAALTVERERLQEERDKLVAAVSGYIGKELIVERGDILYSAVVKGGQPVSEAQHQLVEILDKARQVAESKGARGQDNRPAVKIPSRFVQMPDGRRIYFYQEHVIEHSAEQISRSPQDVVVEVVSLVNSVEGDPVDVDLRLFPNLLVIPRGTVLLEKSLQGGGPVGDLFKGLLEILEKVRGIARSKGIRGGPENRYGEIAYEELFSVLDRLRKSRGQVTLTVLASEDTYIAGPLKIGLEVRKGPHKTEKP